MLKKMTEEEKDSRSPAFIKKDSFSGNFEAIIRAEITNRSKISPVMTSLNPSNITECPRKLAYQIMENRTNKVSDYLSLSSDIFTKKKWMEYFRKFKGIKLVEENLTASECNCNISGVLDAVIQIDDINIATQIFVVRSDEFLEIQKEGALKRHVIEVLIYMWLTELKNGLLIYENSNTHEYLSFHIEPYKPIITSVQKKCLLLMEGKIRGQLPEQPYKNRNGNECKKCEYLKTCWNKE